MPATDNCTWTLSGDENDTWFSSCGEAYSFIDGGPADNNHQFCHVCGKPLVQVIPLGAQENEKEEG